MIDEIGLAGHLARNFPQHLFGQVHVVDKVDVCLVVLQHCEFRIMLSTETLVSEIPIQLINLLEAPDQTPLDGKFLRDTQIEIHVKSMMMSHKRSRVCPAWNRLHNWRLNLKVPAFIQEPSQCANCCRPFAKNVPRILVNQEIDVAASVSGFYVCQPMKLLW